MITPRRIVLRRLERRDLRMTLAWRNRNDVRRWFKTSDILSEEQHFAWFDKNGARADDIVFIAERVCDQHTVGQASIYAIDRERRRAEVGRFIVAPDAAGQGFMHEACALLIERAFGSEALEEVYLDVFADNTRALALYRALGFSVDSETDGLIRMSLKRAAHGAS